MLCANTSAWFTDLWNEEGTWVCDVKEVFQTSNKCILIHNSDISIWII